MRIIILLMVVFSLLLVSCSVNQTTEPQANNTVTPVEPVVTVNQTTTTPAQPKIACYGDSDCGVRTVANAYCFQGNPVGDLYTWQCENPGKTNSKCTKLHKNGIIAECGDTYFCFKGECIQYANCTDSDNGLNFSVKGTVKTNENNLYVDKCEDGDNLVEYYCSTDDRAFSEKEKCDCSMGACT
jgi:hypothetical protein